MAQALLPWREVSVSVIGKERSGGTALARGRGAAGGGRWAVGSGWEGAS